LLLTPMGAKIRDALFGTAAPGKLESLKRPSPERKRLIRRAVFDSAAS